MTKAEQIQDLKKKAQNKSLPASAVQTLNKMIANLEKSEPKDSKKDKKSKVENKDFDQKVLNYLKSKYPHYLFTRHFINNKKFMDGYNDDEYNTAFFEMVDDVREKFLIEGVDDETIANNLVDNYISNIKTTKKTKTAKPKKEKTKTSYKAAGKDVDEMPCEELERMFKERKAKAKKSEKKSKTRPVIEKIVSNVATATKQAIDSVSVEDIKKDPKKFIEKCMKAEKSGEEFINDLKSLLGEEYDKSEVSEGMKKILIHIKGLKAKYVK